ncbi:MAG: hypothetical protein DRM98_00135 [Thermoplasmata archaeon]|nr:MAG: hypothetical protein DRM98_00135 [Thermoplasmata archaeon]
MSVEFDELKRNFPIWCGEIGGKSSINETGVAEAIFYCSSYYRDIVLDYGIEKKLTVNFPLGNIRNTIEHCDISLDKITDRLMLRCSSGDIMYTIEKGDSNPFFIRIYDKKNKLIDVEV